METGRCAELRCDRVDIRGNGSRATARWTRSANTCPSTLGDGEAIHPVGARIVVLRGLFPDFMSPSGGRQTEETIQICSRRWRRNMSPPCHSKTKYCCCSFSSLLSLHNHHSVLVDISSAAPSRFWCYNLMMKCQLGFCPLFRFSGPFPFPALPPAPLDWIRCGLVRFVCRTT